MIKAVIFDMDGVLLDSMPMHIKVWKDIFEKRSLEFNLKIFEKYNGTNTVDIAKSIISEFNLKDSVEDIVKEKHDAEMILEKDMLKLFTETIPVLKKLKSLGYKTAVGTSAMKRTVDYVKKTFNLDDYVDTFVFSDNVKHTKPAPDIFLLAAEKLGIEPKFCAVVEDAVNGIIAANSGNMTSIAITNTSPKESFVNVADHIINNLCELNKKVLLIENKTLSSK